MNVNKVLSDNYNCVEESFIYYLHELSEFNKSAFWDYYNSIIELTQLTKHKGDLDREMLYMVCHTYNYILSSFMWHFCPEDLYSISNLPIDDISSYVERLEFALDGFIKGKIFDENIFELENPTKK